MDTQTQTEPTVVEDNQLAVIADTSGLEVEARQTLLATFSETFRKAGEWAKKAREIKITSLDQKREMKLARETRLALRELRINADNSRKSLKEDINRRGKAIDGMFNVVKALIEPTEQYLKEQEDYADRLLAQQKDQLRKERIDRLAMFGVDGSMYMLSEMSEQAFTQLLDNSKVAHEVRMAAAQKIEEDRIKAENERLIREKSEAAERERMRAENERLRKEAVEAEAAAKAERDRVETARRLEAEKAAKALAAVEEAARQERLKEQALREVERQKAEAKAKEERLAREKLERELVERKAEESKAAAREEAARQKAAAAPDKEKLRALAVAFDTVHLPELSTTEAKASLRKILQAISSLTLLIRAEAEKL